MLVQSKPDWERKESVRMYNIFASLSCSVNRKVVGFRFLTSPVPIFDEMNRAVKGFMRCN